ncbi:Transposase [Thiorhodovibrio winogradskyi]|uniref:Transposase n=1 Tax=Thiorhodovibrio winogradskyi TaxID=77007 RepID=A0ABZ0SB82_9GAMM
MRIQDKKLQSYNSQSGTTGLDCIPFPRKRFKSNTSLDLVAREYQAINGILGCRARTTDSVCRLVSAASERIQGWGDDVSERQRKTFTAEFKAKVGLEAVRGAKSITEIAREYDIHPMQVGRWKNAILEQACRLFECKRGPKKAAERSDQEQLCNEIGRLQTELDWLKKKSGMSL